MAAPLAIPILARVLLYGVIAGTVAAVGWMINEIRKDEEKQRRRRHRKRQHDVSIRERRERG